MRDVRFPQLIFNVEKRWFFTQLPKVERAFSNTSTIRKVDFEGFDLLQFEPDSDSVVDPNWGF